MEHKENPQTLRRPNFVSLQIAKIVCWITGRHDLLHEYKFLKVENEILKSKVIEQHSSGKP